MRKRGLLILTGLLALAMVAGSGWFLVVDQPGRADVIVVLAGETDRRPLRALELLRQGYAPRMVLNVPAESKIYQWSQPDLAANYVRGLPEAASITICPIYGLSTKDEVKDVMRCLEGANARNVLLVTSEYHTRRALSIFSREGPGHNYSVAAAFDPREFGVAWWRHREWAKMNFNEWMRLAWWELVDRWR